MKTSFKNWLTISVLLVGAATFVGCSADSSSNDGGDAASGLGADGNTIVPGFMLKKGASCFDILTIEEPTTDGCDLGVAGLVQMALPVNYNFDTGVLEVGTDGSLGGGQPSFNTGTLVREGDTMDGACKWHESVTSMVTITGDNAFTISVNRKQSMFMSCTNPPPPTGGTCTSIWTWTMKLGTKTPPGCN
jgi:hypothetical protein